jgi:hypothetical protein
MIMTVKSAGKHMYKKCIAVLICLFLVGNLVHGTVLCVGADGHVEFESALHERCTDPVHHQSSGQSHLSHEAGHEGGEHCEPCVDVPISIGLAKISPATEQFSLAFPVPATDVIAAGDMFNFSAYNSASSTFVATPYFTPLRTVILLA